METNGLDFARHLAGVTQARMAELMELPTRTYEDIESGKTKYRGVHKVAAKMALVHVAVEKGDPSIIPMSMWPLIAKAGKLVAPLVPDC